MLAPDFAVFAGQLQSPIGAGSEIGLHRNHKRREPHEKRNHQQCHSSAPGCSRSSRRRITQRRNVSMHLPTRFLCGFAPLRDSISRRGTATFSMIQLKRRRFHSPPTPLNFLMQSSEKAFQCCINTQCGARFSVAEALSACPACGDLLDVDYEWDKLPVPKSLRDFEARWARRSEPLEFSGVWRFRQLLPFAPDAQIVTIGEGQTILQNSAAVGTYCGMAANRLFLQYE